MFTYYQWINIIHAFIIAPFLIYIAYNGYYDIPTSKYVFIALFILAFIALIYHLYKLFFKQ
jgi:hypothetical protein